MDPVTMFAVGTMATAIGTGVKAVSDAGAMKAQGEQDQLRAATESQWADRRANEERAAAQSQAGNETRAARLAQSKLGAVAGASGSGASDPTVMNLWEGIEREGQHNAGMAMAAGEQKAAGIGYQAAINRWTADQNAALRRSAARSTLIGGMMSATGQLLSPMAQRYSSPNMASGSGTGYGARRAG